MKLHKSMQGSSVLTAVVLLVLGLSSSSGKGFVAGQFGVCDEGCLSDSDCGGSRALKCFTSEMASYREVKAACKIRSTADGERGICYSTLSTTGGDPHFSTFDGTKYSFHGQCDLVMARSSGNSGSSGSSGRFSSVFGGSRMDLHARTTLAGDGTWSLISAVALRIGDDVLEFNNDGSYFLNSILDPPLPAKMSGKYIVEKSKHLVSLPDKTLGSSKHEEKTTLTIDLGKKNGKVSQIVISLWKSMLSVKVDAILVDTVGMLGTAGKVGMIGRDESTGQLTDANDMGMQWQVRDNEPMLFQSVQQPQYPQTCTMPISTVKSRRRLRGLENNFDDEYLLQRKRAVLVCANVSDEELRPFCVDDVLRTGDVEIAFGYGDNGGFAF